MILSVSRRTDIPAFYSEWFFNRLKEGFVYVRNPMNEHQVSRIKLSPDIVDCIVFWSKDPAPMLERLGELRDYHYYFQFSVNDYGTEVEPLVPKLTERLDTFKRLSKQLGSERVIWRYDPIIFTDRYTPEAHLQSIRHIAEALRGCTEKCVFSFVDIYPTKNSRQLYQLKNRQLSAEELDSFASQLSQIGKENGLKLSTCAEAIELNKYGIEHNSCIDRALIERITGSKLNVKLDGQRQHCQCVKCSDIGSYDTCPHGCVYCYANFRPSVVKNKTMRYDVNSPILCDALDPICDKVTNRAVTSYKTADITEPSEEYVQLKLF